MKPHPKNSKNFKCTSTPTLSVKPPIIGLLLKSFNEQVLEVTEGCWSFLKDRFAMKTFSQFAFLPRYFPKSIQRTPTYLKMKKLDEAQDQIQKVHQMWKKRIIKKNLIIL